MAVSIFFFFASHQIPGITYVQVIKYQLFEKPKHAKGSGDSVVLKQILQVGFTWGSELVAEHRLTQVTARPHLSLERRREKPSPTGNVGSRGTDGPPET